MPTDADRNRFRQLAGNQLPAPPEGGGEPVAAPYADAQADAYLEAAPACPMRSGGGYDLYGAAATAWDDKALQQDLVAVPVGGTAPLVTEAKQGDASVKYAVPVPAGTGALQANDPRSMRALAARLRRRSCNGGGFRSADVAPPEVVRPGARGRADWPEPEWVERSLILDPATNPDGVINLPAVD